MHQKTRYNIGLAQKKGVEIEIIDKDFSKYFKKFYELMDNTARRNKFGLHGKDYYQNIFKVCEERGNAFLAIAEYDGKIIIINFVFCFGNVANFVFGGSADEYKNLMPSYLTHWEGIKEAKKRGLKFYNFGGYAENDKVYKGWEHLSIFKRKFGGAVFEYGNSYDAIFQPLWYYLYMVKKMLSSIIK
jgi:peptidoglycan pentaglycine glycine transferase (the first glycine)